MNTVTDRVRSRHKELISYRLGLEQRQEAISRIPYHARDKAMDVELLLLGVEVSLYRALESELAELIDGSLSSNFRPPQAVQDT